jgi:hypothetical protein
MVLDQPILFQRNYHIISTVGLGDLSPQTEIGKVFTVIYIFSASVSAPAFLSPSSRSLRGLC